MTVAIALRVAFAASCHLHSVPPQDTRCHKHQRCVQHLDVRGNNFGQNGATIIARALREMQSSKLGKLELGYNGIDDDGAFAIGGVRTWLQGCCDAANVHRAWKQ